ncbi:protein bric-a-brac 1-like isoform X2 [Neocloeon triangulifer]|uniref:protein bric-a-brac 1-like isoform X2 n=1 Tax=Neocloeon triangulifer TaxID=2078957 RepID=UPI00286EDC66|nr:protein bric-a-brac 1-like isoform X2 [Neocloeon triangulifer]
MAAPAASVAASMAAAAGPPPQQFCLRWNNYQTNLTTVFDQLLQSEVFVDVTLACDGHSVKAHKMVLSACSPYFQSLFFDNPCKHPIVILKDIKWPELKAVVEFMYRGEINVLQEQIGPLLKVAETLKIRGLADVNGEPEGHHAPPLAALRSPGPTLESSPKKCGSPDGNSSIADEPLALKMQQQRPKKRRRASGGEKSSCSSSGSPDDGAMGAPANPAAIPTVHLELLESMAGGMMEPSVAAAMAASLAGLSPQEHCRQPSGTPDSMVGLPPPALHPPPPPQSVSDDLEIKPGIAEMILEEERAKLLESSHAWLGASTSSINDSYQYQLQSMWQKCWNTNQSLVHNLRFRERGPLKSWRPETMAEAIFSVLKEGLSLSQAARKYDIPYPTFVLYANRVHNMLGPSADGGADLRPKGRGRPQRILLGVWPEEHIRGVIRAVVFRDPAHIKEEAQTLARLYCMQDPMAQSQQQQQQPFPNLAPNGSMPDGGGRSVTPTPSSAAAAAVAAVAQGLRQQMCGLAAPGSEAGGQQGPSSAAVAALASALLGRDAADNMHQAAATALNNNTMNALLNNGTGGGGLRGHPASMAALTNLSQYKQHSLFGQTRPSEVMYQEHESADEQAKSNHHQHHPMDGVDENDGLHHQQVKPMDSTNAAVLDARVE